jgi:hypothetical protein
MRQTVIYSVYGLFLEGTLSMLGHLVFGRYGSGSEQVVLQAPATPGLMRRVLGALFRRR